MITSQAAILGRRNRSNRLIAAHDAAGLKPFFHPAVTLIAGDGSILLGAAAVLGAFEAQFRDPAFITYVRTPDSIRPDASGARAAEAGGWVARWRGAQGETTMSGTYLACWKKTVGQWVIESELYITLDEAG